MANLGPGLRNNASLSRFMVNGKHTDTCTQLGSGSYGTVEEIDVNGLLCAGKKIHEALLNAGNVGVQVIANRYVQECQLMSELRHPNITLFLGVCFLPDCQLPVLVMEKLDSSLDDLLETVPNIPLPLKQSMLEDVAHGLLYLHQHNPQIVHRDLTAKNVLLTPYFVAKITDFGNSRIANLDPGQLVQTMSRFPGTMVYMPPEALSASTRYGPSLDIFSFGHLALYTLTQVFPDKFLEPTYQPDPNNPLIMGRSEVERRGEYINLLEKELRDGETHPLTQMVKQCLQNAPTGRPTTEQLMRSLEEAKGAIEGPYGKFSKLDAVRQVAMMRELIGQDAQMRRVTNELAAKREDVLRLRQELETARTELQRKDIERQERTSSLPQLRESLEGLRVKLEEMCTKTESDQLALHQDLTGCLAQLQRAMIPLSMPMLEWRRVEDMPSSIDCYPEAIVIKGKVYMGGGTVERYHSGTVMVYDIEHNNWEVLPRYEFMWFSMTTINNQLVLIGGTALSERTNSIGVWNEESQQWTNPLPPMNQIRSGSAVVTYNNKWMVVAGGFDGRDSIQSVEILNIDAEKWFYSAPLPKKQRPHKPSSTVIGNMWYIMNGFGPTASDGVLCASLDDLVTTISSSIGNIVQSPWMQVSTCTALPLEGSTVIALNGALFAVGGGEDRSKCLFVYQPDSKSWVKAGEMPIERYQCACAVLPGDMLLVAGGNGNTSDCRASIAKVNPNFKSIDPECSS